MGIERATRYDEVGVRNLLRSGRHIHADFGLEDLPSLLARETAVVGKDRTVWGFAAVQIEDRPVTLPVYAPTRAHVRAVALAHGISPAQRVPELMSALVAQLAADGDSLQVLAYGGEPWLAAPLVQVGFSEVDRVQFYELEGLARRAANLDQTSVAELRSACRADLANLAELDAVSFPPLWHFGQRDLLELFVRSRLQLAVVDGRLAGYSAIMTNSSYQAQLARLAVHPDFQRRGIGRQLLVDAILHAAHQGFGALVLNTQTDNTRSQSLYQGVGFRAFGRPIPVLATKVAACPE